MHCTRTRTTIATVAASAAALTAALAANGGTITPISQERFTGTEVILPGCKGLADGEQAMSFDPFDSTLETFQQCGSAYGHISAEQSSQIGASSLTATGNSFTKNADLGLIVLGSSVFVVSFELTSASTFTLAGTLIGNPGDPDNTVQGRALIELTGPGNRTVFAHSVGGPGEGTLLTLDDTAALQPGVYTLRASEEVSLIGDVQELGIGQGFFDFTFEISIIGDLDGDGAVGILDFLALLAAWGPCPAPPADCPADLDGDGAAGINDLLALLANWG